LEKILSYNKYNFINENSEFNQYQFGIEPFPLGPGYGFAVDNSMSIYAQQDSPQNDGYYKKAYMVNKLMDVINSINKDSSRNIFNIIKFDNFLEDISNIKNIKILRINTNESYYIDIYISFELNEEEFFGIYKNFNSIQKQPLKSDLFTDNRFPYIDNTYKLKIDNYFLKILNNWFAPEKDKYIALKDVICKDSFGHDISIKKNNEIRVINSSIQNNKYCITLKYKEEKYYILNNDYFYFKYWFKLKNNPE
jgi:hypothetical protein